ncbi:hypothetical protein UA08_07095 [Talaromyces atroroseus]|uniref:Major facilitator superfamily (MFS) profile domain-containing protein n=1 Tax=Talaromyces atroroseus TaxID=1441469 RepID=A0A225AEN7_TALAT|nr:hypothetical protein UA08_07095 [Talaromyces atroroseus]OKL57533.1 hypothetical protein UA08_07095 [Talaromyces atroroseus]
MGNIAETDDIEAVSPSLDAPSVDDKAISTSTVNEAKLLRKIDWRVMPMLFVIYLVAFLDRVNISNALTLGIKTDLDLTGNRANTALVVFYAPYILFEIPSNLLLKKLNPHVWLSGCIVAFGVVMLGQAFVKSYGGLIATRFFLGLAEAGVFPGSFYLISFWYKREESQKRFTIYWSSVILAGAFGGLLATAISKMDGMRGLASWQWIFLLEGIAAILVGIAAFFFTCDFPREASWLTPEEKAFVVAKTKSDESHNVAITKQDYINYFLDPKAYLGAVMYFTNEKPLAIVVPIYAFSYFAATIIQTLGYSTVETQLHTVPPFAATFVFAIILAVWSDRANIRYPFILFGDILIIIGLALLLTKHGKSNFSVEYLGIFFVTMGSFGAGAVIVCWILMNNHGHAERSISSGFTIGFGNAGGIVAVFAFLSKDAPYYTTGYWVLMSMTIVGVVTTVLYAFCVWREKRKALANGQVAKANSLSL